MKKSLLCLLVLWAASLQEVLAQGCSVCTKTAAGLGESSAHGLNAGILYLAAIPLIFMVTVGYLWYRRTKASRDDGASGFHY